MNTLKKKLFIVLSSVAAIVAVAVAAFLGTQNTRVTEVHAEGEHTHCVCGGTMSDEAKAASGHVCDDTQVWEAWDGTTGAIPTTAGDHYLYLTKNISWSVAVTLKPDVNLHICLNGFTITKKQNSSGAMKFFLLGYISNGTCSNSISICDCVGGGKFAYTAGQTHNDHSSFLQNYTTSGATNQTRVDFYGGTIGQATIKKDTSSGGAITVSANTVLNIYGGTINGALCYTADGTKVNNNGAAIRVAGGTVNMYGGTICNGKANNGGSIYLEGGTFNMHGGTISGSSALNNGGSIYANTKNATINMYPGAVIEGGSAVNGGNIHLVGAVLNMNGGEISGGTATDRGGNISLTFSEVSAQANLNGGKVSGGTAKNAGGNVAAAGNGAKITISGATVTGGTINPDATTASYTNTETYVNSYAGYGGNIYLQGNSSLTMTAGEVSNGTINVTGTGLGLGGNIALIAWRNNKDTQLAGSITISGGVVKNGKITSSSSKENGNTVLGGANIAVGGGISSGMDQKGTLNLTAGQLLIESDEYGLFYTGTATKAYAKGGNLYVSPGSTANINAAAGKSVLISGGYTNTKNWAAGGNIYNAGTLKMTGDVTVSGGHGTTQLDGGNLYGPSTVTGAKFLNGNSKTGGGICLESGTSTFTSCEFEGNVATSLGGAVYLKGNPTVTFTDCTFTENQAGTNGGALGAAQTGSAAPYKYPTVTIDGCLFDTNKATGYGGSLYYYGNVPMTVKDSSLVGGEAGTCGGNIYIINTVEGDAPANREQKLTNCYVGEGVAKGEGSSNGGGNIYHGAACTLVLEEGTQVVNGAAVMKGGNIYVEQRADCVLQIEEGAEIKKGATQKDSGGNIACAGTVIMNGGLIEEGFGRAGGNVWINIGNGIGDASTIGKFVMNGGTIKNGRTFQPGTPNVVNAGGGMNVRVNGSYIGGKWYNPGQFIMNGGTVELDDTPFEYEGETYASDECLANGANIYSAGYVELNGGTVKGGKAPNGGSFHMEGVASTTGAEGQYPKTVIAGGTVVGDESASSAISFGSRDTLEMTSGYVAGAICALDKATASVVLNGGYFTEIPDADFMAAGKGAISCTETKDEVVYLYYISAANLLTVTSQTAVLEQSVAAVSGGGYYAPGSLVAITAQEVAQSQFKFIGWFKNEVSGSPAFTSASANVDLEENVTYIAVYEWVGATDSVGSVSVNITAPAGQTMKVKVGDAAEQEYTSSYSGKVSAGAEITVTYSGDDFAFWRNENGKLVTKSNEYTFTAFSDARLEVATKAADGTVVFKSATNQVVKTLNVASLTDSDLSAIPVPVRHGMTGGQWNLTAAQINAALASQGYCEVAAVGYTEDAAKKVTVTLTTVVGDAWVEAGSTTVVSENGLVKLTAPASDKTFSYFATGSVDNQKILAYGTEYTGNFAEDTTVYAVFDVDVEKKAPVVTLDYATFTASGEKFSFSISATREIPAEYELVEQGILFTTGTAAPEYGVSGTTKVVSLGKDLNGTTILNIRNVGAGVSIQAKGYAIVKKAGSNVTEIVYSENASVTAQ